MSIKAYNIFLGETMPKNFKSFFIAFLVLIFSSSTFAKELKLTKDSVLVTDSAQREILKVKGKGLRHKKITFISIKVYEATLFVTKEALSAKNLSDILNTKKVALSIHPLRSFSGSKMEAATLEAYKANNINTKTVSQKEFISIISKNKVVKDEPILIYGEVQETGDTIFIQQNNVLKKISGPSGFVKDVFSIWLGTPVDDDMKDLKTKLL